MALASSPKTLLVTASGDTEILGEDSPVGTYQITALKIIPTTGTVVSFYLHDGDGTDLVGDSDDTLELDNNGGLGQRDFTIDYNPDGALECKALSINLSDTQPVQVVVTFRHQAA